MTENIEKHNPIYQYLIHYLYFAVCSYVFLVGKIGKTQFSTLYYKIWMILCDMVFRDYSFPT